MFLLRSLLLTTLVLTITATSFADDKNQANKKDTKAAKKTSKLDRVVLEKAFAEKLTGSTLVGHFSVDGRDNSGGKPERYTLEKVSKVNGNYWVFTASIKYGNKNETIPIPITVQVLWAGDTPMISMTNLTIPGMGTFTSRVFFYGNRYAGTWQHGKVGGHMWGMIEKVAKDKDSEKKNGTDKK